MPNKIDPAATVERLRAAGVPLRALDDKNARDLDPSMQSMMAIVDHLLGMMAIVDHLLDRIEALEARNSAKERG